MPIRFRCAYCNQLMGIARRKAGSVVKCPKCAGDVVVPNPDDGGSPEGPEGPLPDSPSPEAPENKPAGLFEQPDFSQVLNEGPMKPMRPPGPRPGPPLVPSRQDYAPEIDVEPVLLPEPRGWMLKPPLLIFSAILFLLLLGLAFFLGWHFGQAAFERQLTRPT